MTPIESPYDTRFLTLANVAMEAIGELALLQNKDPELLLAELLFTSNKNVHQNGTEAVANRLLQSYPILSEAIV